MGERLPVISGREAAAALLKLGFELLPNRGKGSHMALWKEGLGRPLIIPDHKELDRGTLMSIIRSSGVSKEDFIASLA